MQKRRTGRAACPSLEEQRGQEAGGFRPLDAVRLEDREGRGLAHEALAEGDPLQVDQQLAAAGMLERVDDPGDGGALVAEDDRLRGVPRRLDVRRSELIGAREGDERV